MDVTQYCENDMKRWNSLGNSIYHKLLYDGSVSSGVNVMRLHFHNSQPQFLSHCSFFT